MTLPAGPVIWTSAPGSVSHRKLELLPTVDSSAVFLLRTPLPLLPTRA
eukprot:CAMPEP_0113550276 /NCGR_PEP_ID=MMETSP0015_2-20120614/13896_1 /TAXON_ID=2838 /ORGANISM="Odontella" /LENGTH=47 /DNA_ID=CAMNT_0000451073 /DNA_START=22 /DNA_END=162 /DNA_ORIENTATION=- /assembly_acc=CAM_ASM_000160